MKKACCIILGIIAAAVIAFIIWNPLPSFAGSSPPCDFQLAHLRGAVEQTVTDMGQGNPKSHTLRTALSDLGYECAWYADGRFRCQIQK